MKNFQFLLIKLAEEAGEVAKQALKTAQFGWRTESPEGEAIDNLALLRGEFSDLIAILEMISEEEKVYVTYEGWLVDEKKLKVNKYRDHSKSLGYLCTP